MNTLKSAALVIILAGVLYGVYVTLHQPPAQPAAETAKDLDVELPSDTPNSEAAADSHGGSPRHLGGSNFPHTENSAEPDDGSSGFGPPQTLSESLPPPDAVTADGPGNHSPAHEPPLTVGNPRTGEVNLTARNFKRDWTNATYQVEEGKFREALATLTPYYRSPDLTADEQAQLLEWLDALAAKVIYSKEHLLASAHVVTSDREKLVDVARKYGVSTQLLVSINADVVNNPAVLIPTTKLKVIPGPFRAEVDLAGSELTIFLGNLYAGRFPFALGDERPAPGEYQVRETKMDKTYIGDPRIIPAGDPSNPYGQWWIDLGNNACIHGSPAKSQPGRVLGCISLSPQDAQNVAAILSVGSKVMIR